MSEDQAAIANTLFPPPPVYYKEYVDEKIGIEELEPPRVDWVEEETRWMCFGDVLSTTPRIPTSAEVGLPPLIDAATPQQSMSTLLHSFLHTMLLLLDALTNTARNPGDLQARGWAHEGDQYIQHLTNLAATMMVEANQVRSMQAEATLVLLMEKQLHERRAQTAAIRRSRPDVSQIVQILHESLDQKH